MKCLTYYMLLLLGAMTNTPVNGDPTDCPFSWITLGSQNPSMSCYLITTKTKRSWQDSRSFCQEMGGDLLQIDSVEEKDSIVKLLNFYERQGADREWWVGLVDKVWGNGQIWVDNSSYTETFLQWKAGQQTTYDKSKTCVSYNNGLLWHQNCSKLNEFICKRNRDYPVWCDSQNSWEYINNKCYKVSDTHMTWESARDECQNQNSDLMVITDHATEAILYNFIDSRKKDMWIGLKLGTHSAEFQWVGKGNQSIDTEQTYWEPTVHSTNNALSIATSSNDSCVIANHTFGPQNNWQLVPCNRTAQFICQKAQYLPGSCTFRNGTCNYTLETRWTVQNGSYIIIPIAHRPRTVVKMGQDDNSYLIFDPFSSIGTNDTGTTYEVTSPVIPGGDYCLSFWYTIPLGHANVTVFVNDAIVWSRVAFHQNWTEVLIDISENIHFVISFRTTKTLSRSSYVVIDNIDLSAEYGGLTKCTARLSLPPIHSDQTTLTPPLPTWHSSISFLKSSLSMHTQPTSTSSAKQIIELTTQKIHMTTQESPTTTQKIPTLEKSIITSCTSSGWNITIDIGLLKDLYPDLIVTNIYFGTNACRGAVDGNYLIFRPGLRECLTSERISNGALIYVNDLYYAVYDPVHPFIIRQHVWTYSIECDVIRNEATSSHVHHDVEYHNASTTGHYGISMAFYKDPNFLQHVSGNPLHVSVGDSVYVKVFTLMTDWTVKMKLHTCYTKPYSESVDDKKYYLIQNGCEVDANTHIMSQATHESTFVFQDFEYDSYHEGLDISCNTTFCKTTDYSPQCLQACNANPLLVG